MRVIAGRCAGVRLAAPRGQATRPLTDRVKEALFASLEPRLAGASVLDLYAGSGAGGIETLSRGAAGAVFVERDRTAADSIRANLARTGLTGVGRVIVDDVERFLARGPNVRHDVILVDPPYEVALAPEVVDRIALHLAPRGVAVVKHFWRTAPPAVEALRTLRTRRFGETALTFLESAGEEVR
ncbi:MAG: 16S rRNA (guanine(966)-N(2))-methyltransferase RsmD [Candidatus Limnocylindria bacterium]